MGKELLSFISQSQDLIDSIPEKYAEIKNIAVDFCVVVKLHRLITVIYKVAFSINKLFHSKIRRGMDKVNINVMFTL